jgi:hypothetical protein
LLTQTAAADLDATLADRPTRRDKRLMTLALAYYLALSLSNALIREPMHDEGVTADQVLGSLELGHAGREHPVSEVYRTLDAPGRPVSAVVSALQQRGMHPPAYYLLLNEWVKFAGASRLSLRTPTLLAGGASIVGMFWLGALTLPKAVGPWPALLLAVSPWHVRIATYARPYSVALALAIWTSVLAAMLARRSARPRLALAGFSVLSLLGLYTTYQHALVVVWQMATVVYVRVQHHRDAGRSAVVSAAVVGLLVLGFLPWLPTLIRHLAITRHSSYYFGGVMPLSSWPRAGALLLRKFLFADLNAHLAWACSALILGAVTLAIVWWSLKNRLAIWRGPRPASRLVLSTLLLPSMLAGADLLHGSHTLFNSKTSYFLFPVLLLLITGALAAAPQAWYRRLALGAICLLLATSGPVRIYRDSRSESDYGRLSRWLKRTDTCGHLLLLDAAPRGFVYPLLMVLRDHDVRNVRVALLAAPPRTREVRTDADSCPAQRLTAVYFARPSSDARAPAPRIPADVYSGHPASSVAVFRNLTPAGSFD